MNRLLAASSIVLVLGVAAGTARADDAEAFEGARDWYTSITTGTQPDPVPTKKAPLAYGLDALDADACKTLSFGKLVDATGLASLSACLAATLGEIGGDTEITSEATTYRVVQASFPKKRRKAIKAAARGSTIIATTVTGAEGTLDLFFAVDDLGTVKAVWASFSAG